jgi:uncharacterized protein
MEDPVAMLKKFPLMNDYWKDKRADISRIKVPAYILASYSTFLHLPGSLRGFEDMSHNDKWSVVLRLPCLLHGRWLILLQVANP